MWIGVLYTYSKLYDLEENITVVERKKEEKKYGEKESSYFTIPRVFMIFRRRRRHLVLQFGKK